MSRLPIRPELETMPWRIAKLPFARGYPVPWFVAWVKGEPEFRAADHEKFGRAVNEKLCWVCGEKLGRNMAFVAGPMCGLNRTSAEPPCHLECAQWSARNCPFLSRPHAKRREDGLEGQPVQEMPGIAILRNPGVTLIWVTRSYQLFGDGSGGVLIRMGEPDLTEWYAEGRRATREQVLASIDSGLPFLEEIARAQEGATAELAKVRQRFEVFLPSASAFVASLPDQEVAK